MQQQHLKFSMSNTLGWWCYLKFLVPKTFLLYGWLPRGPCVLGLVVKSSGREADLASRRSTGVPKCAELNQCIWIRSSTLADAHLQILVHWTKPESLQGMAMMR